ncbi:Phage virion morphogenesis family protein [Arthrobacter sp. ok909]|uniref:phage virion morphogenesis protein n=1 Tax=Arthrobacter sp. ok909 TaxID=1761746 RepID=UPI000882E1C3|nr:phage virion morphogenesis protein [Arthrobacter sp. ok909]SDP33134.1 Phage virion morphogenesis family protein [Arthrobacter sp. ok909]
MGLNLQIEITGDRETVRRLAAMGESLDRLPDAMRETGTYLTGFFSGEVFASHGGAIGMPWPRLSPKTEAQKAREFPGRPMLVRSGLMQRSFRSSFTDSSARVTNTADYFKYHQSDLPRTKLPRRAMMELDAARQRAIAEIVRQAVNRKLAAL